MLVEIKEKADASLLPEIQQRWGDVTVHSEAYWLLAWTPGHDGGQR